MLVCNLQNTEFYGPIFSFFLRNKSVSKIGPEPAKPAISLALPRSAPTDLVLFAGTEPEEGEGQGLKVDERPSTCTILSLRRHLS